MNVESAFLPSAGSIRMGGMSSIALAIFTYPSMRCQSTNTICPSSFLLASHGGTSISSIIQMTKADDSLRTSNSDKQLTALLRPRRISDILQLIHKKRLSASLLPPRPAARSFPVSSIPRWRKDRKTCSEAGSHTGSCRSSQQLRGLARCLR